jgi:hypothetical protein
MYSSASDISALGRAILSYKLLSPVITSRWLKPFAFSSDPRAMVGMPWGVRRINLGLPYRNIVTYNKGGRIGDYTSLLVLIPDFDVGFTILVAGENLQGGNFGLAGMPRS